MESEKTDALNESSDQQAQEAPHKADQEKNEQEAQAPGSKAGKSKVWKRVILVVVIVLVVLLAAGGIAAAAFLNAGKEELLETPTTSYSYRTLRHNGTKYVYNDAVTTIGIIGTDRLYGDGPQDTNGEADAVMVLAYDTSNGKMSLVNVPRNLIVDFTVTMPSGNERDYHTFLTVAYNFGTNDAEGSEYVCQAVSRLFGGITVNNYVTLLESCVAPLTTAMGGVTLVSIDDVPTVGIETGKEYTLLGWDALRYVQYRNPAIMSSPADRMRRQQQFARAFLDQTIAAVKKDPAILQEFYDIITDPDYMSTTLNINEMAYLASVALTQGIDDLSLLTVPYEATYDPAVGISEYIPKESELMDMLIDIYYKLAE